MAINSRDKVVVKLLGCVYNDTEDSTIIRIETQQMFLILDSFNFILAKEEFEKRLENALNKYLPSGLPSDIKGRYIIACAIYNLAEIMHITKDELTKRRIEVINDPTYTDYISQEEINKFKREREERLRRYEEERRR